MIRLPSNCGCTDIHAVRTSSAATPASITASITARALAFTSAITPAMRRDRTDTPTVAMNTSGLPLASPWPTTVMSPMV
ncbi:Uncharacterised protein [Mycobacteroides abscessus subsp. abscessus]|nr:Uncharacterised protein [Mycobacteroides abscessus subsp. abscessus]